jgi:hypothetical protein
MSSIGFLDTSTSKGRIMQGDIYEDILDILLKKYNLDFININNQKKYSYYDFLNRNKDFPSILELKSKKVGVDKNNGNINLVSCHKIECFRKSKLKYKTLRFFYIYCYIEPNYNHTFAIYEIKLDEIDDDIFFKTYMKDKQPYLEIPLRYFIPLEENINILK